MFLKVITILFFVALSAGQGFSASVNHLGFDRLTLIAFGDSITQGLARDYDGEGGYITWGILKPPFGGRVYQEWGYEWYLESIIESELPMPSTIYNWGHMGFTTVDALSCTDQPNNCLDTVLMSSSAEQAQLLLLMFGANDVYPHHGISIDAFIFNLRQIIEKTRSYGIEPVLATITPNTNKDRWFDKEIINNWNVRIRQLAVEEDVVLADHYSVMETDWKEFTSGDGLHLSALGNEKMARTWYDAILNSKTLNPKTMNPGVFDLLLRP